DVSEHLLLEPHVALHGVDEVRDQVMASLELHLDLGERLVDPQSPLDETVVDPDDQHDEDDDDGKDDQDGWRHAPLRYSAAFANRVRASLQPSMFERRAHDPTVTALIRPGSLLPSGQGTHRSPRPPVVGS